MSNDLRARDRLPYNFVDGLRIRGLDIEAILNSGEYGLQLATNAETQAGTINTKAVSPAGLKSVTDTLVSDFDDKLLSGEYGLQLATTAQALEGTVTDKAVSPASLKAVTDQRISEAIAQSKKASGPSNYFNYQM